MMKVIAGSSRKCLRPIIISIYLIKYWASHRFPELLSALSPGFHFLTSRWAWPFWTSQATSKQGSLAADRRASCPLARASDLHQFPTAYPCPTRWKTYSAQASSEDKAATTGEENSLNARKNKKHRTALSQPTEKAPLSSQQFWCSFSSINKLHGEMYFSAFSVVNVLKLFLLTYMQILSLCLCPPLLPGFKLTELD